MKSAKKSLNQIVAKVLADIYAQPDLKHDVFDYLNPVVLKSYTAFSLSENAEGVSVKGDMEQTRQVENILSKELPNLIDIYTRLPIEYRNEKVLGNGLTHRQTLVKSLQVLVSKLVAIENQSYEKEDRSMTVGHDVLREKYQDDNTTLFFEKTSENGLEPEFHNSFDWQGYKKANPVKANLEKALESDTYHANDNGEEVLHTIMVDKNTGEMKIREKNRVRKFIFSKARVVGNIMANLFLEGIWRHPVRFFIIFLVSTAVMTGVRWINHGDQISDIEQSMVTPEDMINQLFAHRSDELRQVTIDSLKLYAKNNGLEMLMEKKDGRSTVYFSKKLNQQDCMNIIGAFNKDNKSVFINDTYVSGDQKTIPDEEKQVLCKLPENELYTGYFLDEEKKDNANNNNNGKGNK
jgi:hypothetical protein